MGIYIFPRGICQKVNVIARLEFNLCMGVSPLNKNDFKIKQILISVREPLLVQYFLFSIHADTHKKGINITIIYPFMVK